MTKVPETVRKELAALIVKPEGEIDFSDLPATTRKDWQGAVRGRSYRPVKRDSVTSKDAKVCMVYQELSSWQERVTH